jgi:dTDP-4-amino-4,6-dideoxygalactose transaminase
LSVEALGLKAGQAVLVPTMTFAATAEVGRYLGAVPILVDCDPVTGNLDLADASRKLEDLRAGRLSPKLPRNTKVVGIIPVHVGGLMLDMDVVSSWARARGLWVVEDAAHAFPAAYRRSRLKEWRPPAGRAPEPGARSSNWMHSRPPSSFASVMARATR